jgi:hypothetical protein
MTIAWPVAGRLVGWLVVAALAVFAAFYLSTSTALLGHVIALPQPNVSAPAPNSGSGRSQAVQQSGPVQSSQSSAGAAQQSDSTAPPTGTTGSGGAGFADAGPDIVGAAQPQTVQCGVKPCPHLVK